MIPSKCELHHVAISDATLDILERALVGEYVPVEDSDHVLALLADWRYA